MSPAVLSRRETRRMTFSNARDCTLSLPLPSPTPPHNKTGCAAADADGEGTRIPTSGRRIEAAVSRVEGSCPPLLERLVCASHPHRRVFVRGLVCLLLVTGFLPCFLSFFYLSTHIALCDALRVYTQTPPAQDVKEGCEVKLKRFSEENTILLHKLAHINLRGRP